MDKVVAMQTLSAEELELIKYCKFYMALILNDILKETPITDLREVREQELKRGDIQTFQQQAINYSGMLAAFSERLFWTDYSLLFQRINEKLQTTVKEELLNLMQLPSLRPEKARVLYLKGIKTTNDVLNAKIGDIVESFDKVESYQSMRKQNLLDNKLRYNYLFNLAHKITAEARLLKLANPEQDENETKEFKMGKKVQSEFMLDSDQE